MSAWRASSKPSTYAAGSEQVLESPMRAVDPAPWIDRAVARTASAPRAGDGHERADRVVAAVHDRAGQLRGERRLEPLVGRLGHDHDVRLREVAAEPGRATVELGSGAALRELVEEVRDEVPLREALDQAHLLDPHGHLPGDRAGELDAARRVGDDQPEQLVVGDEGHGDASPPGSGGQLRAELGERDRRAGARPDRVRVTQPEVVSPALDQVDVARLGLEQAARAVGDRGKELLERLGSRDRLGELGERLELVDAALHLPVEPGVLDRAGDERGGGDDEVDLVAGELARRLRVCGDDADHIAAPPLDRDARGATGTAPPRAPGRT